jgi:hypothetical protein
MSNHTSYAWLDGALESARTRQNLARKTAEVAFALLVLAALTGAWLAFFTFVPFDFTPPRPG